MLDADGELLVTVPLVQGPGAAPYNGQDEAVTVRIPDDAGTVLTQSGMTGPAD